ncbi:hypothetical protein BDW22DRAFT_405763 [Trametopsis cervina]|nr:hypothetical protein BDW22DRAFT_405763 [Trametopsis cervina]
MVCATEPAKPGEWRRVRSTCGLNRVSTPSGIYQLFNTRDYGPTAFKSEDWHTRAETLQRRVPGATGYPITFICSWLNGPAIVDADPPVWQGRRGVQVPKLIKLMQSLCRSCSKGLCSFEKPVGSRFRIDHGASTVFKATWQVSTAIPYSAVVSEAKNLPVKGQLTIPMNKPGTKWSTASNFCSFTGPPLLVPNERPGPTHLRPIQLRHATHSRP